MKSIAFTYLCRYDFILMVLNVLICNIKKETDLLGLYFLFKVF